MVVDEAELRSSSNVLEDDVHPRIILCCVEHMEWFAEREVAHHIKCRTIIHAHEVKICTLLLHPPEDLDEFVCILDEQRCLLCKGSLRERRRENLPRAGVFGWISFEDERRCTAEGSAVTIPVLRWDVTWCIFNSMAVDVAPRIWVEEAEFVG